MTVSGILNTIYFSGNLPELTVLSTDDVTVVLSCEGTEVFTHTYQPDANGHVAIDLRDAVEPSLTFTLSDVSSPYIQTGIMKTFTVTINDGESSSTVTFQAIRGGIAHTSGTATSFLQSNFLTWQPNIKRVTYYTPEFLTYYAATSVSIKCRAYFNDGTSQLLTLASLSASKVWTVPVQYAIIAGLTSNLPSYYDVWAESSTGAQLTYVQRYAAQDMRSEQEEWILFENSLGGIDTFRAYGDSENTAQHVHNIAKIEEVSEEYRIDTTRLHKKNTGWLDKRQRQWLLDFFPSKGKYVYIDSAIRKVVVTESDVSYSAKDLPSNYTFTYKFSEDKPYLNLTRLTAPAEVLDIQVPDVGSFTLAPRLVEFPRLALSAGALIPVQSPYSDEWAATTIADLVNYFAASAQGGDVSVGITPEQVELMIQQVGRQLFLSKTGADTAQGLITFMQGLQAEELATFSQGLLAVTAAFFQGGIKSSDFIEGMYSGRGWEINAAGKAEVNTLFVRNAMYVLEMIVNRQNYLEGDQILTESDTIERVESLGTDASGDGLYRLHLKDKWEGYLTGQREHNVLRGIYNNLAAQQVGMGISGAGRYFTSWMRVLSDDVNAVHQEAGNNYIDVVMYPNSMVPGGVNFPPCEMMHIARWGNAASETAGMTDAEKAELKHLQTTFYLSATEGRIIKLKQVNKPIIDNWSYGLTLGTTPSFLTDGTFQPTRDGEPIDLAPLIDDTLDYLFADGIVVRDIIMIDKQGKPEVHYVQYTHWDDSGATTYYFETKNPLTGLYETSDVWHLGCRYRCLVTGTTEEPRWDSSDWLMIEGNANLSMEFASSNGYSFRKGYVDTTVTPHVFVGANDISESSMIVSWEWDRDSGNANADAGWGELRVNRVLHITDADLPDGWGKANPVYFTCTCVVNNGREDVYIQNQLIVN